MKTMSESLADLAARVEELQDSAGAAKQKNRAALEARQQQLQDTIDREVEEFEAAAHDAAETAGTWWSDTKNSIQRQVNAMRADLEERKGEHKHDRAVRRADRAEEDAAAAIALAVYCLDAAEWAVVDAVLARAEADDVVPPE